MTTVISDASRINYFILIGEVDILPRLFKTVLIPPAVLRELQHPKTPKLVYDWATVEAPIKIDSTLNLHLGESEAISLAMERHISAVLMDDRQAWLVAESRTIVPIGTINLLESADELGILDFAQAASKLRATSFRIEQSMLDSALKRAQLRKQSLK